MLSPEDGSGPNLHLQRVPEDKVAKNRMHLDLAMRSLEDEAQRLEGLGARRLHPHPLDEDGNRRLLMADPEGNEFCVCDLCGASGD